MREKLIIRIVFFAIFIAIINTVKVASANTLDVNKSHVNSKDVNQEINWEKYRVSSEAVGTDISAEKLDLGFKYYQRKNYKKAAEYFLKAAEQGVSKAQYNLGLIYDSVVQDYKEAVKWYKKAAEQGHLGAQHNLGLMYKNGQGVTQNCVKAHMWFNLSAANGDKNMITARNICAAMMTASQIAEAQRLASEWKPTTAYLTSEN